MRSMILTEVCL